MSSIAWKEVNWPLVDSRVFRYQTRIFKATRDNNIPKVKYLQKRLVKSLDAKLVAIKIVTTLKRYKRKTDFDKKIFVPDLQKADLIKNLKLDGKTLPIQSSKQKKHALNIAIIKDRAKQVLCKLALEPEWEARFEANSYGFRPGRYCHDAIEAIFLSLRADLQDKHYNKFVLAADVKCLDQICQNYIVKKLETIPEIEKQVKAWLKTGILNELSDVKNETDIIEKIIGRPQVGIISPLLVNIAFHGIENHIKNWIYHKTSFIKTNKSTNNVKQASIEFIRYANNFLVIHKEKAVVQEAKKEISNWLSIGPSIPLREKETSVHNINNGFYFLGFSIIIITRKNTRKIKIYPSRNSQKLLLLKIRGIIQNNRSASSYQLISLIRPLIISWANYFKYSECSKIYRKLTHLIFQKLRAWVFRKDTRNGKKIIKQRYFPTGRSYSFSEIRHYDNWVLNGRKLIKNGTFKKKFLPPLYWIKREKWIKIKAIKSPFDGDTLYWEKRTQNNKK